MMDQAIRELPTQFGYEPVIEQEAQLDRKEKVIVCGMGGSNHSTDLIRGLYPKLRITTHRDYGLPEWHEAELEKSMVIASSYSGNTEEVISGYHEAREKGLSLAVIAAGGKLIELAKADGVPYIQMPKPSDTFQPRSGSGYSFIGLLKLMGHEDIIEVCRALENKLRPDDMEAKGKALAEKLQNKVPVLYGSKFSKAVLNNWKVKFNESAKIPTFVNVIPELNHNEMNGFDVIESTRSLMDVFSFVFLRSKYDHPRVQKRMEVLAKLFTDRKLPVHVEAYEGESPLEQVFNSILLADWTAWYTADYYGTEPEEVPMVEEFKKMIA